MIMTPQEAEKIISILVNILNRNIDGRISLELCKGIISSISEELSKMIAPQPTSAAKETKKEAGDALP
jgi:hypothetical protein